MNRRWIAALGSLALVLAGTAAEAQWRDGGRERERGYERRGGYPGGGYGARRFAEPGGGYGEGRGYRERGYGGDGAPGYGGPGYAGGGSWRRGQVLPPRYRESYVPDPGRYRLRAAPNGYGWVGDGRNAYLTQRSTGMVLEAVPGAYDPAPAAGPRRRPR